MAVHWIIPLLFVVVGPDDVSPKPKYSTGRTHVRNEFVRTQTSTNLCSANSKGLFVAVDLHNGNTHLTLSIRRIAHGHHHPHRTQKPRPRPPPFRALMADLGSKSPVDVQIIDMMNLTGFAVTVSRWYMEAAQDVWRWRWTRTAPRGDLMACPMTTGRTQHSKEGDASQKAAFETSFAENVGSKD